MAEVESFHFDFETNGEQALREIERLERQLDDIERQALQSDEVLSRFGSSMDINTSITELAGLTAGLFGADMALESFNNKLEDQTEVIKLSDRLGASADELARWQQVAQNAGVESETFRDNMTDLNERIQDFQMAGGEGEFAEIMDFLGISITNTKGELKSATEMMGDFAKASETVDPEKLSGMLNAISFDESLVNTIMKGGAEVEKLLGNASGLSDKQVKATKEFNEVINELQGSFGNLGNEVFNDILPVFTWFLDKINIGIKFLKENEKFAEGLFIALGAVITRYAIPPLIEMGIAGAAAMAPFLPAIAIIGGLATAFAFLYDDISNFIAGNDSFIGQIAKDYPVVGEIVNGLVSGIKSAIDVLGGLADFLITLFTDPIKALNILWDQIKGLAENVMSLFSFFGDDEEKKVKVTEEIEQKKIKPPADKEEDSFFSGASKFFSFSSDEEKKEPGEKRDKNNNLTENLDNSKTENINNAIDNTSNSINNLTENLDNSKTENINNAIDNTSNSINNLTENLDNSKTENTSIENKIIDDKLSNINIDIDDPEISLPQDNLKKDASLNDFSQKNINENLSNEFDNSISNIDNSINENNQINNQPINNVSLDLKPTNEILMDILNFLPNLPNEINKVINDMPPAEKEKILNDGNINNLIKNENFNSENFTNNTNEFKNFSEITKNIDLSKIQNIINNNAGNNIQNSQATKNINITSNPNINISLSDTNSQDIDMEQLANLINDKVTESIGNIANDIYNEYDDNLDN